MTIFVLLLFFREMIRLSVYMLIRGANIFLLTGFSKVFTNPTKPD